MIVRLPAAVVQRLASFVVACWWLLALAPAASAQQTLNLQLYQQGTANPNFTSSSFTSIAVTKYGLVWAGSLNQGLYRLNTRATTPQWEKMTPQLTQVGIRDLKTDRRGNLWVAHTGLNPASTATTGGVDKYDSVGVWENHYGHLANNGNLQTRAVRSLYVAPNRIVWTANASTLTAGVTDKGGFSFMSEGATQFTRSVANIPGLDGSCQAIGGGGTTPEVWIAMNRSCPASGTCFSTRLVRYSGAGVFLGYIDNTISQLPLSNASPGVLVRAIHFDRFNRAWVGFSDGTFAVCDLALPASAWVYVNNPAIVPAGAAVNFNAITSDAGGNVYIGTTQGLLRYTRGQHPAGIASYTRFTTLNGLPSDNINGIAIADNGDRWLATGNGIVRWASDPLSVYHLKAPGTYSTRTGLDHKAVGAIKVAADYTETTLFAVAMANAQNLTLRIRERTTLPNADQSVGTLRIIRQTNDSVLVVYKHPAFVDSATSYRLLHLDLLDTTVPASTLPVASYRLQVERPPLMLVHGLWSKGSEAFPGLREKLMQEGLYDNINKILFADYTSDDALIANAQPFIRHKDALLRYYQQSQISASKVDIICHSMGGLVSRDYIQSNLYKNDVNKLITLNTPHSGSPIPNLVRTFPTAAKYGMSLLDKNPSNGALTDLSYTGVALGNLNNNPDTKQVYIHALTSTINLNLPNPRDIANVPLRLGIYRFILSWMVLSKGVTAFDSYLQNSVFQNPNDLIVGRDSQMGGLTGTFTQNVPNLWHLSGGNAMVHQYMLDLLRENPKTNVHFTTNGFHPVGIGSIFQRTSNGTLKAAPASNLPARQTASTLAITSPTRNSLQANLDSIQVTVAGSADVTNILLLCGGKSPSAYTKLIAGSSGSAYIQVPKDLLGRVRLAAFAFSDTSYVQMDTLSFQINTTATLNAIRIDPGFMYLKRNDSTLVDAVGLFSDGTQRSLLGAPGVSVQFPNGLARLSGQGQVVGLTVGTDSLRVLYGGKRAAIPIVIEANPCVNPVAAAGADIVACSAGTVALGGQAAQPGLSYDWRVTPAIAGFSSTLAQPSVTLPAVSTATRYVFSLTATNAALGNCAATDQVNVDVVPPLATPVATATPATIAPGQTSTLSISSPVAGTTYTWSGPGLQATTGSSVVAAPPGTTQYTVVASSGTCGSSSPAQVSVTVTAAPAPTLTTWNGSVSTDWNTAANWSAGVPTPTLSALLPGGLSRYPQLASGPASLNTLTLQAGSTLLLQNAQLEIGGDVVNQGGTLSQSGGTLSLAGNWTNNGTFAATGGLVSLTGPASQTLGGSGPTTFWSLTVGAGNATLGAAASVQRVLTLTGNLTTNANALTLLSSSAGTAMVVNTGGRVVGAATMQRYLNPSLNSGLGYRHYSSPVQATSVADLATSGFTPLVNPLYNTQGNSVSPFPTVYGYDEARLSGSSATTQDFDYGYFSPSTLNAPLTPGRGYTVNLAAGQTVDLVGTLATGTVPVGPLGRGAQAAAGWHLLGNPYPAPLDWKKARPSLPTGLLDAVYVYKSSSQYGGTYQFYQNGFGTLPNGLIPAMQGFFVRVAQPVAAFGFLDAWRSTVYEDPSFNRTTADSRPALQLDLVDARQVHDPAYIYFEPGATTGVDAHYDAEKLPNTTGLNLASVAAGTGLAVNGLPLLTASTVVPLTVGVPTAGTYTLQAASLANFGGAAVYLLDATTGQQTDLRQQASYGFLASSGALLAGRFSLRFEAAKPLATSTASLAASVALYPNPARKMAWVELPATLGRQPVAATLLDALGRVVRSYTLPAQGTQTHSLSLAEVPAGVYALHLMTGETQVVKRLVVE